MALGQIMSSKYQIILFRKSLKTSFSVISYTYSSLPIDVQTKACDIADVIFLIVQKRFVLIKLIEILSKLLVQPKFDGRIYRKTIDSNNNKNETSRNRYLLKSELMSLMRINPSFVLDK